MDFWDNTMATLTFTCWPAYIYWQIRSKNISMLSLTWNLKRAWKNRADKKNERQSCSLLNMTEVCPLRGCACSLSLVLSLSLSPVPSNFPKESTAEESLCSFDREGGCCVNILCERMPFVRLNRALGDLSRAARRVLAFIPTPGWWWGLCTSRSAGSESSLRGR